MGSSLVVYGRRPTDLALAALIQARLGLPVYLYEADQTQQGFLVEQWPCGLVVEIGPVPQMLIDARIVSQTRVAVQTCCDDRDDHDGPATTKTGHGFPIIVSSGTRPRRDVPAPRKRCSQPSRSRRGASCTPGDLS